MNKKVMIIGLGDLGELVLEFLARSSSSMEIITADINEESGVEKTNNVLFGAAQMGYYPKMKFTKLDLYDIDQTAELLAKEQPDIIYNSTTLQSWWVITELPKESFDKILEARLGPWIPMHLTLIYKLMQAVKKSGIKTDVINSSFPDATNSMLDKVGLAPTIGIGNLDNIIPPLRMIVSKKMQVPINNVSIYMCAQHYINFQAARWGDTGGAPYYLKIVVAGNDVTNQFNLDELLADIPRIAQRPGGRSGQSLVASSAVKNILAMINDTEEITHAPGPNGLPGGYPVRIGSQGVEVVLPQEISLDEAIKINEEAQAYDGVEKIEEDGSVVLTDKAYNVMKEVFGYDCKTLKLEETEERAKELGELVRKYAKSVGCEHLAKFVRA